ncbi:sigma-E factor regulatory protein RseB domain-containing protein [Geobacillus thermodenitrificans]|uniref:LolA family protein n=1 Tax=Geobacillus thermodenitrificans TaxID=33940 RepID=UPI002E1EE9E4|nr:sigma-E factor regulatory protein RseB domain-containing protein [Geobacillus thermodenitrificans]
MHDNERRLSDYIDQLNAEKKPKEHEHSAADPELQELFHTVRLVRSLREPAMPERNFPAKLVRTVTDQLVPTKPKKKKRAWMASIVGIAAVLALSLLMHIVSLFDQPNIVKAMEKAFQDVNAYHGFLEIVETNAQGKTTTQAKLEIWADKQGRYYIQELEGSNKGLITVNNGQTKWQIHHSEKQVHRFSAFPDPYRFAFELGNEIKEIKQAVSTKTIGEEKAANRPSWVVEVTPQGGEPYRIWIDKETHLPLQKQYAMHHGIQYKITYTKIEWNDAIPEKLLAYHVPKGFQEINQNPEQIVANIGEVNEIIGFLPDVINQIPAGYVQDRIAIVPDKKLVKIYYRASNKEIVIIQGKATGKWKLAPNAMVGKIHQQTAEIQSPVVEEAGVLGAGGPYAGLTDLHSIRWWQNGFEYAVIGHADLEDLVAFTKELTNGAFEMPAKEEPSSSKPKVNVPVDLEQEKNDQKSVDAGSSPWKLDPVFVAQVFVSLQMSPEGITGDYPIRYEDLRIVQNNGKEAVVEVNADNAPIKRVYLKRLIRQDATGIWTVVGYDPAS